MTRFCFSMLLVAASAAFSADLKLGIIGTDSSHSVEFTRILNDANDPEHVAGAKIVAAWEGGSADVKESASRRDKYAADLRTKWNITLYPDIPSLLKQVDAVLIESVDGRPHLEEAKQVFAAKKPVFIDKPLSDSLDDARTIARLAKQAGVPWFSASSLRYADWVQQLKQTHNDGVFAWGPGPQEDHQRLDLSWYAIHPIEILYTLMGPGCQEVMRVSTSDAEVITGRWKDGRLGTVRAVRPYSDYGAVVFRGKSTVQSPSGSKFSYRLLVQQIVTFFQTGNPPVANDETLEEFAFMDAAQKSKAEDGKPVRLQ
jgi:predicted dehydrogenase